MIGYPLSFIIHVIAVFLEILGTEPEFLKNIPVYTLLAQYPSNKVHYRRKDDFIERLLFGIGKLILGVYILVFAVITSIFFMFGTTRKILEFYIGLYYEETSYDVNYGEEGGDAPVYTSGSLKTTSNNPSDPIEVVKFRYASGEISENEYRQMLSNLGKTSNSKEKICLSCGISNEYDSQFCLSCGSALPAK